MINENFKQPAENSTDKTKIIVRYVAGSCGHFVGCLLWLLIKGEKIVLSDTNVATKESYEFEQHQNFNNFRDFGKNQRKFYNATMPPIDAASIEWFRNNVVWYDSPFDTYLTCIHAVNPDPILFAFKNTKLVNIVFDLEDRDQISYNMIYKVPTDYKKDFVLWSDRYTRAVRTLKQHGKKIKVDYTLSNNVRFQSWIQKVSMGNWDASYMEYSAPPEIPTYTVNFKDITNGNLIKQIPALAEFVGSKLDDRTHVAAIKLIKDYVKAQQTVPWTLNFDDYD